jgi:hypothetical protein
VPLFPEINGTKVNPVTNVDSNYGQSFVCISIKTKATTTAKAIYSALTEAKVFFYYDNTKFSETSLSEDLNLDFSLGQRLKDAIGKASEGNLSEALELAMGIGAPRTEKKTSRMFKGLQGLEPLLLPIPDTPFTMITKPSKFDVNVFSQFLIPGLHTTYGNLPSNFGLAVESWSRPSIPSVCEHSESQRKVINVKRVQYGLIG